MQVRELSASRHNVHTTYRPTSPAHSAHHLVAGNCVSPLKGSRLARSLCLVAGWRVGFGRGTGRPSRGIQPSRRLRDLRHPSAFAPCPEKKGRKPSSFARPNGSAAQRCTYDIIRDTFSYQEHTYLFFRSWRSVPALLRPFTVHRRRLRRRAPPEELREQASPLASLHLKLPATVAVQLPLRASNAGIWQLFTLPLWG